MRRKFKNLGEIVTINKSLHKYSLVKLPSFKKDKLPSEREKYPFLLSYIPFKYGLKINYFKDRL